MTSYDGDGSNFGGNSLSVPSIFRILVSLFLLFGGRAERLSPTTQTTLPAVALSIVPTPVPRGFPNIIQDGKKKVTEHVPSIVGGIISKAPDVITSVVDKMVHTITMEFRELNFDREAYKTSMPNLTLVPPPPNDDNSNQTSEGRRSMNNIPGVLFHGSIVWIWFILSILQLGFLGFIGGFAIYYYAKLKPVLDELKGKIKDLKKVMEFADEFDDKLLGYVNRAKDELEKKLSEFLGKIVNTDILEKVNMVQQWMFDVIKNSFGKVPGFSIVGKLLDLKGKGGKRELIDASTPPDYIIVSETQANGIPTLDQATRDPTFSPVLDLVARHSPETALIATTTGTVTHTKTAKYADSAGIVISSVTGTISVGSNTAIAPVFSTTGTLSLGSSAVTASLTSSTGTPVLGSSSALFPLPSPTGTLFPSSNKINISTSSMPFTAGAGCLHILPLFAWLARSHKFRSTHSGKHIASPRRTQASYNYWQAYTMLRLSAQSLCLTFNEGNGALASITRTTLSCDSFSETFQEQEDLASDACQAQPLYDAIVHAGNEYCIESDRIGMGPSPSACLKKKAKRQAQAHLKSKSQFCDYLESFVGQKIGFDVGGCDDANPSSPAASDSGGAEPTQDQESSGDSSPTEQIEQTQSQTSKSRSSVHSAFGPSSLHTTSSNQVSNPLRSSTPVSPEPFPSTSSTITSSMQGYPVPSSSMTSATQGYTPSSSRVVNCHTSVPELTFAGPAPAYAPVITSVSPQPTGYNGMGLHSWGMSPMLGVPCGYTGSTIVPSGTILGELTWYDGPPPDGNIPACQNGYIQHSEAIVAINWEIFDNARAVATGISGLCGRSMKAWCGNSEKITLWVRDRCEGCRPQDIDVIRDVFPFCTHTGVGRTSVTWSWEPEMAVQTSA